MERTALFFDELRPDQLPKAGGKGGALSYLYRKGFPVPEGFVILPAAFEGDEPAPGAWLEIQGCLARMRGSGGETSFAVRSSALAEDSASASFAGQFETVLGLRDDDEVREAIRTVRRSRHGEAVRTYSEAKVVDTSHEVAVVVQRLVQADIAGVLFTADPISGDRGRMTGNFVFGLGDELVSGRASASAFTLRRPVNFWEGWRYEGAPGLERFAGKLAKLAGRLEVDFGCPQDIEWAIAGDDLYLLQSRPITTLAGQNPATGEWNDSATGYYLWSNVNFGEAVPHVMSPLSWSVLQLVFETWRVLPGFASSGNIGGRPYLNLSVFASAMRALGKGTRETLELLEGLLYTRVPPGIEIPIIPLPAHFAVSILAGLVGMQIRQAAAVRGLDRFIASNPDWCRRATGRVEAARTSADLHALWLGEIAPHLTKTVWSVMGSVSGFATCTARLRRDLRTLVGQDDAEALISSGSHGPDANGGADMLASLGPVLGIAMVARGELAREKYLADYGHRGPDEFELSVPRPAEDAGWLDAQLARYEGSPVDVQSLLSRRQRDFEAAWRRLEGGNPRVAPSIRRRIDEVAARARVREAVRSEYVRDRWVARIFAVRAGELTGLGDGVFFLTVEELLGVLMGDRGPVGQIDRRRETYERYRTLPSYPSIILGRFDPFRWAADPRRRADVFDAMGSYSGPAEVVHGAGQRIVGAPGSPGRVEGTVRRLDRPEDGDQLRDGEVLVTSQTDIAWTPLFPRVGAVVTDVGAPLSHAAIVARELGIPAVVGCSDATARLRTGDRVLVDGGRGTVELLLTAGSS